MTEQLTTRPYLKDMITFLTSKRYTASHSNLSLPHPALIPSSSSSPPKETIHKTRCGTGDRFTRVLICWIFLQT